VACVGVGSSPPSVSKRGGGKTLFPTFLAPVRRGLCRSGPVPSARVKAVAEVGRRLCNTTFLAPAWRGLCRSRLVPFRPVSQRAREVRRCFPPSWHPSCAVKLPCATELRTRLNGKRSPRARERDGEKKKGSVPPSKRLPVGRRPSEWAVGCSRKRRLRCKRRRTRRSQIPFSLSPSPDRERDGGNRAGRSRIPCDGRRRDTASEAKEGCLIYGGLRVAWLV